MNVCNLHLYYIFYHFPLVADIIDAINTLVGIIVGVVIAVIVLIAMCIAIPVTIACCIGGLYVLPNTMRQ